MYCNPYIFFSFEESCNIKEVAVKTRLGGVKKDSETLFIQNKLHRLLLIPAQWLSSKLKPTSILQDQYGLQQFRRVEQHGNVILQFNLIRMVYNILMLLVFVASDEVSFS